MKISLYHFGEREEKLRSNTEGWRVEDLLQNILESEAKAKCCEIYKGHSVCLVEWMGYQSRAATLIYPGAGTLTPEPPQHGFPGTNFTTQPQVYYTFQTK
ncbi:hypothetical protein STEG23_031010, partial [Scotinomys teguina]